jgi:hypothetical protein
MAKQAPTTTKRKSTKKSRPGVHSKKKNSNSKNAKFYTKKNVGQG